MLTHMIEATNEEPNGGHGMNHGKFLIARFTPEEWQRRCLVDADFGSERSLIDRVGWTPEHLLVLDLQTGEGALFRPHGYARADLHKHRIWVCPLFEPFLTWLYTQDTKDITLLPERVHLIAGSDMQGYRRPGPKG